MLLSKRSAARQTLAREYELLPQSLSTNKKTLPALYSSITIVWRSACISAYQTLLLS